MMSKEEATEFYEKYIDENEAEIKEPGVGFNKWLIALSIIVDVDITDMHIDLVY